jgi:diacylglycerol O-acyltransferase
VERVGERRRLGVQDALWLEMDRPNNLMVVDSVVWTAEPVEWDRLVEVIRDRMVERYPVFRSRPVKDDDGHWWWEEDPSFDLAAHVQRARLDDPDDPRSLQALVAEHRTDELDRSRPLWTVTLVERYRSGSAWLLRSHHAIADGVRMVELAMSLFDASPDGGSVVAPSVKLHAAAARAAAPAARPSPARAAVHGLRVSASAARTAAVGAARTVVADAGSYVSAVAGTAASALRETAQLARTAPTNPVGAASGLLADSTAAVSRAAHAVRASLDAALPAGGPLVDLLSAAPADIDVARKFLLGTRNHPTIWTGHASTGKGVAWADPLPLADVKAVAKAQGATVNDVLVACLAGALNGYLTDHQAHCASVSFMVPVNLKPLDHSLPDELGNGFALVQLELPTDEPDPLTVLGTVRRRMSRIKHGHEAVVGFAVQETVSGLSRTLYEAAVDLLANRSVGVLTNVPGPPRPVYLAGSRIEGIVGWAPLSGDQAMSVTIYSYDGMVVVGIACDTALVPDHETIVDGFAPVFRTLERRSRRRQAS